MKQNKIFGIVTLYNPQKKNIDNIYKIAEQVDTLFVADNSAVAYENDFFDDKIVYCFNNGNKGLSGAFNRIFKTFDSRFSDEDMILFFDQDTEIPPNHIVKLINEYYHLSKTESVGALGPVYIDEKNDLEQLPNTKTYINKETLKVETIITSSMLCKYKNLKCIDFWNENVFLDMADWDLCWRLRAKNLNCYMTKVSLIKHNVGNKCINISGKQLPMWNSFRFYYQIRDGIYLTKQSYVYTKEKIHYWGEIILRYIWQLFVGNERIKQIYYGMLACYDAMNNYKKSLEDR